MDNSFTVNAALIAAISAIIAPTITTFINRYADIKLKKLDVFQNAKRKAYNDFAESFSVLYHATVMEGEEPIRKILSATYQAMTYSSPKTRELLKVFSKNIEKGHWDSHEELNFYMNNFSHVSML